MLLLEANQLIQCLSLPLESGILLKLNVQLFCPAQLSRLIRLFLVELGLSASPALSASLLSACLFLTFLEFGPLEPLLALLDLL